MKNFREQNIKNACIKTKLKKEVSTILRRPTRFNRHGVMLIFISRKHIQRVSRLPRFPKQKYS